MLTISRILFFLLLPHRHPPLSLSIPAPLAWGGVLMVVNLLLNTYMNKNFTVLIRRIQKLSPSKPHRRALKSDIRQNGKGRFARALSVFALFCVKAVHHPNLLSPRLSPILINCDRALSRRAQTRTRLMMWPSIHCFFFFTLSLFFF